MLLAAASLAKPIPHKPLAAHYTTEPPPTYRIAIVYDEPPQFEKTARPGSDREEPHDHLSRNPDKQREAERPANQFPQHFASLDQGILHKRHVQAPDLRRFGKSGATGSTLDPDPDIHHDGWQRLAHLAIHTRADGVRHRGVDRRRVALGLRVFKASRHHDSTKAPIYNGPFPAVKARREVGKREVDRLVVAACLIGVDGEQGSEEYEGHERGHDSKDRHGSTL